MSIPVVEFWKLAVRSRVISLDEAKSLHATFLHVPGAAKNANSTTVAQWLTAQGVLSRYQASQLLAGKSGPFVFGDYKVVDRVSSGPLAGLYRAVHTSSHQPAILYFCVPNGRTDQDWATVQQQAQAALLGQYPQVGRVFGMVEADQQRFLVLEDVLGTHPTELPTAGSTITAPPAPSRPVPVGTKQDPSLDSKPPAAAASDDFFSIPDTPSTTSKKKKSRRSSTLLYSGIGCLGLIVLAGLVLSRSHPTETKPDDKVVADTVTDELPQSAPEESNAPVEAAKPPATALPDAPQSHGAKTVEQGNSTSRDAVEIADDGQTLWTSPTHGPPLDLRYLASGGQMFLLVRPSALLGTDEGEKVLAALGPRGEAARDFVRSATGQDLSSIDRLLVAFYPADGAPVQVAMVVTLREEVPKEQLLQAWHNPKVVSKPKPFYQGAAWSYYLPTEGNGRTFAVAPTNLMTEMLGMEGPPALRREMEKLLRDTDDTRQITLLVAPNFLFTDGQAILSGDMAKLKQPLLAYLGEGVLAAELSFHLTDENLFGEMRVFGALDHSPYELAEMYRTRLSELPTAIEEYLAALNPQRYGRLVLTRMPRMIGELAAYTRVGDENRHAVLRCYLPASAAHNLTLATELALSERPGGGSAAEVAAAPKKPATVAEALQQKISLSFPRNTLEKCMEMLSEEIDTPVHIEGKDLQLEGITRNQSFGLDERDEPAAEILRKVMQRANPDGKLVYVIKPLEPGGKDVVFITTRAAAAKRGDKLPKELEQAPPKK